MSENSVTPTINICEPHRSLVARMVETMRKPRKIVLEPFAHADSLDPTTRENAAFLLECYEDTAELKVFDFVGSPYDEGVEQSLRNEMKASVPNKFGKHVYRYEDYFPTDLQESTPAQSRR